MPSAAVVHARYSIDPSRPWLGISPLGWSRATANLAAGLEQRLGEEAGGPVGHVLPVPQGPEPESDEGDADEDDSDPLGPLRADLANAKGSTVLTETSAAGWGEGRERAPQRDFVPARIIAGAPP